MWIATVVREAEHKTQIRAHLIEWSDYNNTLLSSFSSKEQMDFGRVIEMDLFDVGCQ